MSSAEITDNILDKKGTTKCYTEFIEFLCKNETIKDII